MPISSASLRIRRLRHRFGAGAPRLAIRTHVAWYWRVLAVILVLSLSLALSAWIYDAGRRFAGFHSEESSRQIDDLQRQIAALQTELSGLRATAGAAESALQIERTAQERIAQQIRSLEVENARLKQDLAFFDGVLSPGGAVGDALVSIKRLQVLPLDEAGRFKFRLLVVGGDARQAKPFSGVLRLLARVRQEGKDVMIEHPRPDGPDAEGIRFDVRNFQRIEGELAIPAGALLLDVEARIIQGGVTLASQTTKL